MKKIIIVISCIVFSSCKKDVEEESLVYNQLINYRNELKFAVKDQKNYIVEHINVNKKRNDSLIEILNEINISFKKIKYKKRNKVVELRNSINKTYNLHQNFETSTYSEKVSDTIFNRLMEIDFLKLERNFQIYYLLPRGCM